MTYAREFVICYILNQFVTFRIYKRTFEAVTESNNEEEFSLILNVLFKLDKIDASMCAESRAINNVKIKRSRLSKMSRF